MKKLIEEAKNIAEKAASEGRALTEDEKTTVETAIAGAKAVKADSELRKAVDALGTELEVIKPEPIVSASPKNSGEKLLADSKFKSWLDEANANGTPDAKSLSNSPSVSIGGFKATVTGASDTSAGAMVRNDVYTPVTQAYDRGITALNLITIGATNSDAVDYARVNVLTTVNAANPKAEGTAADESTLTFVKTTAPVRDVRAFLPVSVRALNDAAQLETIVNNYLSYSLSEKIEDQIINGDGTGENMLGIVNTSGINSQAFDTNIVTTIRKAIRRCRLAGNAKPTAVLLHPEDMEKIDLLVGTVGVDYLFGGPSVSSTATIWGLPRIESSAVPVGFALVGDFRQAALWSRQDVTVSLYPQHSDFAVKGLVAAVSNARAAFGVLNPAAFCVADLTA